MKEFDCRTAGSPCRAAVTATDDADLERQISGHLRAVHGIEPNETLLTYLVSTARDSSGRGTGATHA
jgi:predicted small metal-binding protein